MTCTWLRLDIEDVESAFFVVLFCFVLFCSLTPLSVFCRRPNARFMSKRIPEDIAAEDTQIKRSRLILQQLWSMDYDVVWESILCPDWPADYSVLIEALSDTIKRIVFGKICLVYRYIDVKKLGKLIGCTDDEVVRFAVNEYGAEHSDGVIVLPTLNKEKRMSEIDIQRLQSVLVQISQ